MTQHHINQGSFADVFARADPLKVKAPPDGFDFCAPCHGSGKRFDPPRCCEECGGLGHQLKSELRR